MVVVFLFNLMCAIVSCDPFYPPPTSSPYIGKSESSFLKEYRGARNFDLDSSTITLDLPPPLVKTQSGVVEGYMMDVISGRKVWKLRDEL